MIYVPDLENYSCYVVIDSETIRAYKETPVNNLDVNYRDYYVNSHYLFNDGIETFTQSSILPVCLDNSVLTNDIYYRNDLPQILFIFVVFFFFCIFLPFKLFTRFNWRLKL